MKPDAVSLLRRNDLRRDTNTKMRACSMFWSNFRRYGGSLTVGMNVQGADIPSAASEITYALSSLLDM